MGRIKGEEALKKRKALPFFSYPLFLRGVKEKKESSQKEEKGGRQNRKEKKRCASLRFAKKRKEKMRFASLRKEKKRTHARVRCFLNSLT